MMPVCVQGVCRACRRRVWLLCGPAGQRYAWPHDHGRSEGAAITLEEERRDGGPRSAYDMISFQGAEGSTAMRVGRIRSTALARVEIEKSRNLVNKAMPLQPRALPRTVFVCLAPGQDCGVCWLERPGGSAAQHRHMLSFPTASANPPACMHYYVDGVPGGQAVGTTRRDETAAAVAVEVLGPRRGGGRRAWRPRQRQRHGRRQHYAKQTPITAGGGQAG